MPDAPGPVAILREGHHLLVSISAALDDMEMVRFRQELSEAIGAHRARCVLIDVAALDVLDSFGSRTIRDLAETARLRGASAVIVGVPPQVAWAMVRLGIDTGPMVTALDLEDGLQLVDDPLSSEEQKP